MYFPEFLRQPKQGLPPLKTFQARDQETLSYRAYESDSTSNKVVICLHGSGSHGEYLHDLALYLSDRIGMCVVPNIRGHFGSGTRRGDCAYVGQLEDDIIDLIQELHLQNKKIYLVGHSSGGGLAIRLAGSQYRDWFAGYILLAPAIPTAPTMKKEKIWAELSLFKIVALSILNRFGVTRFNHATVIRFHMPPEWQNGTETLRYTFSLNTSYHPRIPYQKDIEGLGDRYLCIVGEKDELMQPHAYKNILNSDKIHILPHERHLTLVNHLDAMKMIVKWILDEENCRDLDNPLQAPSKQY